MTLPKTFRAGLVQLCAGRSIKANLDQAMSLVRQAAEQGALYVQTPEQTSFMETGRAALLSNIVEEELDPALAMFQEAARSLKIHLHIGSLAIKVSAEKAANRSFLIDTEGEVSARYDKIHLFDVDLDGAESYRESSSYRSGEIAVIADLPWGRLGLSICYDLRFPALYRALAESGADFLAIPSAFTKQTGEAHWHVLQRARAIETGSFVFAAAQGGTHENGRETFGHSLIVDPWGSILAEAGTEPCVIMADIDPDLVGVARRRIPALQHGRRFELTMPPKNSRLHVVKT